ncbi:hypothetical protein, unknown function [Leishmania braziliensis MHOM/BR/75/M2904]|uniref:Uncharacterized protein n=2 Tax=Leishmania braziliensis TaxID=5660 RepID=A4HBZ7_LEIBR|nr:hypothetical protein, unknown function [Leishmania braziliensis MHOM/BR/75/M2904]CAJ2472653.1 unnamed protein product [Leishmania braziliensis]CAM38943.1 hypothetical protein, unknown function [Leishmania braziliensis MHOM/BR/75/M2904]SYZ65774.1 hypothetical_protein [Leishmania braziliensis MHOM/BR/75/M2904]
MNHRPVGHQGPCASQDPHRPPLYREEEQQRTTPIAPTLMSSASLASSMTVDEHNTAHIGTCTVSSRSRGATSGLNVLSRMVMHATHATAPWPRVRQPNRIQAPPRLAPLSEEPIVERGFAPQPTAPAPFALAEPSKETLRTRRRMYAAAGAGTACICSARSALPLLPLSAAVQATQWVTPEPVWRRSKPLTRLPVTTLGQAPNDEVASASDVVVVFSGIGTLNKETNGLGGTEALVQSTAAKPTRDVKSAARHVDYRGTAAQTERMDSPFTVKIATERSPVTSPAALAAPVGPSRGASALSSKETDELVGAPVSNVGVVKTCEEDAVDVSTSSSWTPSSSLHRSNCDAHSNGDSALWAHEAPQQPDYANKHQLPAIFSQLVQDLLAEGPRADVEGDDDSLEEWIHSWFAKQCATQPPLLLHLHSVKHVRGLDEAAVGAAVAEACKCGEGSSDYVEPREKLAVAEKVGGTARAGSAAHPAGGPSTTSSAVEVAVTTTAKPASASLFQSPPHQYVPLTVEYIRSDLQSRTTSGASQHATSPHKVPPTQPPPVSPVTLHSACASSTSHLPSHTAADGSGDLLVAVGGLPSSPQQQQQQQPQTAKPLSGAPHLPVPPSARSMSSRQNLVVAAALAGVSEGDKNAGGIRPKLATTAYAVFAHSSPSSAPKEAAHPHK